MNGYCHLLRTFLTFNLLLPSSCVLEKGNDFARLPQNAACTRWLWRKRVVKAPDVKRMGCDVKAVTLNLEPLNIISKIPRKDCNRFRQNQIRREMFVV